MLIAGCISTGGDRMAVNRSEITEKDRAKREGLEGREKLWWWGVR
jgi:hypothetical protein